MKRQSSVYLSLGKFRISPSGIENLSKAIAAEGSERLLTLSSIDITTKHSTFTYDTVEEIRSNKVWEKSINKFSIHFREIEKYGEHESRAISIWGGVGGENYISVRGDEESWVVGMGNIVRDMIRKHEVWYRHLAAWGLVQMVYPMIIVGLSIYFISFELVAPNTENLEDGSENIVGDYNYEYYAILAVIFPAYWLAYKVPIGSRIVEDTSVDKKGSRWLVLGSLLGIAGLVATVVSIFL